MNKIKVSIPLMIMILISLPVFSLTWEEIFEALGTESYDFPVNARNKQVTCWKEVYWEEYIEGDSDYKGYVNSYNDKIKINCPY